MKRFFVLLGVFLIFACVLGGCGDDNNIFHALSVRYNVDGSGCLTKAENYNDHSEYTSGNYRSIIYIWYCADYQSYDGVYVSLTFSNDNDGSGCLRFDSEYVTDGIC